jgi:hypothetical protein
MEAYFSENNFTGTIPSELGALGLLVRMSLSGNRLRGSIPTELGQLTHAEQLYFDNTNLNGTLPDEICANRVPNGGFLESLYGPCCLHLLQQPRVRCFF